MNVLEVLETEVYARWFSRLRDRQAKARILRRDIARAREIAEEV